MTVIDNEIWVEKYRPKTINEIQGHENIKKVFNAFIERGNIPHLIMYGEPSTGKTSSALALANEFFGDSIDNNFKELNASDERGIDVVRTKIKNFAKTKPMNSFDYNIMFLDEMDALTSDAQAALRRTMEQYSSNCRFILSCNYMNKVISPLQSRGLPLYFGKMSVEDMTKYIDMICEKEGITIEEDAKISLIKNYNIDARKILNSLQACSLVSTEIDSKLLSSLMKIPSEEIVRQMITFAIDGNYDKSSEILLSEFINNGFDGLTILNNIYEIFKEFKDNVDSTMFIKINQVIGRTEVALNEGNTPYIQLDALLSDMSMLSQITPSCPVRGC